MKTVTLKSGQTLQLQEASFTDAWNLTQALARQLGESLPGLKLDSLDAESIMKQDIDVGKLMGVLAQVISSKDVFALVWPCFKPCLYNEQPVTQEVFQEPKARPDFLPSVVEIVKLNVLPFMSGLDLRSLMPASQAKPKGQK
jgi:hypothetical protein